VTVTPLADASVVALTYASGSPVYNSTTGPSGAGTYAATASLTDKSNYAFTGDSVNPGTLAIGQTVRVMEIDGATAGLTAARDEGRRESAPLARDGSVDRKRIEGRLHDAEPLRPPCSLVGG